MMMMIIIIIIIILRIVLFCDYNSILIVLVHV